MKELLHKIWITLKGFMVVWLPMLCWGVAIWIYMQIGTLNPWLAICCFVLATIYLVLGTVAAYGIGIIFNEITGEDKDD